MLSLQSQISNAFDLDQVKGGEHELIVASQH